MKSNLFHWFFFFFFIYFQILMSLIKDVLMIMVKKIGENPFLVMPLNTTQVIQFLYVTSITCVYIVYIVYYCYVFLFICKISITWLEIHYFSKRGVSLWRFANEKYSNNLQGKKKNLLSCIFYNISFKVVSSS